MRIHNEILDAIRKHGSDAYPEECCGFLLGSMTADGNDVAAVTPVKNRRKTNRDRRFSISADDFQDADLAAREQGWDIVGFYHSHPDHSAEPSATDLAEATFPGYTYAIVSVFDHRPQEVTAWSLSPDRSRFETEPIEITTEALVTP